MQFLESHVPELSCVEKSIKDCPSLIDTMMLDWEHIINLFNK